MTHGPILVTGAGGDIGISLARILREEWPDASIIGADCREDSIGSAFYDRFEKLPRADEDDYVAALSKLVRTTEAQVVIPLSEAELAWLIAWRKAGRSLAKARVVMANRLTIETGLDKYATAELLRSAGIAVPETGIVGRHVPGDHDCIIKPRSGQGSKELLHVPRHRYDAMKEGRKGAIWQRWLKDEREEYTCGVFRTERGGVRSIAFRRTLVGGHTASGIVVDNAAIRRVCEEVAEVLDLEGSINVQLRMDQGEPLIFEINPRFSSTVGFRHRLGFRDAIWSIEACLGNPIGDYVPPPAGSRIDRVGFELVRPPA